MKLGLDIGSTTIKYVVLNEHNEILEQKYERHYAQIVPKTIEILRHMQEEYPQQSAVQLTISGSAGMGIADSCHIPFMQEVYATRVASKAFTPGTDVIIELGGEDAKILFLTGGTEVRMNGSCAGGTGAFIDQMATLLQMAPSDMNELAGSVGQNLHHRLALRGVCQVGHSAPA